MRAAFERARDACPSAMREHHYMVAGGHVLIRTVGSKLDAIVHPPMSHLAAPANDSPPALTIEVWDGEETGIDYPLSGPEEGPRNNFTVKASGDNLIVVERREFVRSWFDRSTHRAATFVAATRHLYVDERARPFQRPLSVWLRDRQFQVLTSSLVGRRGKGVTFVGMSGTGKTTASLSCLQAGFRFLSDDFFALKETGDGNYLGHSIYNSCLINAEHLQRFPDLVPIGQPANHEEQDKNLVILSDIYLGQMDRQIEIAAIGLPRRVDTEETSFRPASAKDALFALAPTALMASSLPGNRAIENLSDFVNRVPSFWLEFGKDVNRIAEKVDYLLAQLPED